MRQRLPLPALKGRNYWRNQSISILHLFVPLQAKLGIRGEVVAEVAEEVGRAVDGAGVLKLNEAEMTTLREHYAPPETRFANKTFSSVRRRQ
jgi:hypothetical protein